MKDQNCLRCGAAIPGYAMFCPSCGVAVPHAEESSTGAISSLAGRQPLAQWLKRGLESLITFVAVSISRWQVVLWLIFIVQFLVLVGTAQAHRLPPAMLVIGFAVVSGTVVAMHARKLRGLWFFVGFIAAIFANAYLGVLFGAGV